jgi:hypothetical protein
MQENARFFTPSVLTKIIRSCLWMGVLMCFAYTCAAMDDEGRPSEHFCPITLAVMIEPVVAADGVTYERTAIQEHLNRSPNDARSPITGLILPNRHLFNNQALRTMIMDWRPGGQNIPSALDNQDPVRIAARVKEEFEKNTALLDSAKDRHVVAFLGNTGIGKSTLLNFLAGRELAVDQFGAGYVLACSDDETAMSIGNDGNTRTLYPKFIDVGGLRFFDLPRFNDMDGTERNLVSAAFIRKILLDAISVRLVIVASENEFTAGRGVAVRQLFNCIKQLCVVGQDDVSLVDNGLFVVTKVTCNPQAEIREFLLQTINAQDTEAVREQLNFWGRQGRLSRMFHPMWKDNNREMRGQILDLIRSTTPSRILSINTSVLYPPNTKRALEKMFFKVIEETFRHKLAILSENLSDYDKAIDFYASEDFWQKFDLDVCQEQKTIGLLKELCTSPYTKSMRNFEKENEEGRQNHIQSLRRQRQERVEDIERKVKEKAEIVISSLVLSNSGDFAPFDFPYHQYFYDQVCGSTSIQKLTIDLKEQEIAHKCYANLISQHSCKQAKRWHEDFMRKQQELTDKIEEMNRKLSNVSNLNAEIGNTEEKLLKNLSTTIPRALGIPQRYRGIYLNFLNGVLIYRPNQGSDDGMVTLPIRELANPLKTTFDLSRCGDAGQYLSISTGYRTENRLENKGKVEIWFAPRFLIEKELNDTAAHFKPIMGDWKQEAPVGMFWTWGGYDDMNCYDYLTTKSIDDLSKNDLYENWKVAAQRRKWDVGPETLSEERATWSPRFVLHF